MNLGTNCLVAQSGGPTTVINASLAGVIQAVLAHSNIHTIYGSLHGIEGVLEENFINLTELFSSQPQLLQTLKQTPAMYLGSCRYKLTDPGNSNADYIKIFQVFKKYNIQYFFYIGGNDSMDTVYKLSHYAKQTGYKINIIGIPKTIDNDLVHIDHTPGYGSAAKYIATSMLEIAHDTYIYNTKTVTIVEIMGRNAGWLTAASALARNNYNMAPHLIYLPEKTFSITCFLSDVEEQLKEKEHVIIAVSEGVKDKNGLYISANSSDKDQFGHVMLSGTGTYLENITKKKLNCKVRSIELNVLQRCAAHISSETDMREAFELGRFAVETAFKGHTAEMVLLTRTNNTPYKIQFDTIAIDFVANNEKKVPDSFIHPKGNDITEDFLSYAKPLIKGEPTILYENGLPVYLPVNHLSYT